MLFSTQQKAIALLILATVLFSAKGIFIKFAYQYGVEPMPLLVIRMLMALPIYAAVFFQQYRQEKDCLHGRNVLWTVLFGLSGYYIASYYDLEGLLYLPASLERLVLFTYPSLVILLAALFLGQKIVARVAIWLVVTYLGLCLVFIEDVLSHDIQSKEQLLGAVMVFIAAIAFAVYMIGSEVMQRSLSSRMFTSIAMLAATMMILLHFSWFYAWRDLLLLPWQVYFWAFMVSMFSTVIPSFLLAAGIRSLGAAVSGVIGTTGPILTLLMAQFFLDEQLTFWQMLGFGVVMFGVLCISRARTKAV